jgi:hypothetical protein
VGAWSANKLEIVRGGVLEDSRQIEVYQTSAHAALEALISNSTNVPLIETAEETKHIVESLSPRSLSVSTFKDFTQIGVNADQPNLVVSPLLATNFDILDVGSRLTVLGYRGKILAITPPLPNLQAVLGEIRTQLGHLDLELAVGEPV